ncbi:hypothetical protein JW935_04905 [candidate division KSB1 bacterium]|nr:hypothetical protein [candidate division KSB1 bacterium]
MTEDDKKMEMSRQVGVARPDKNGMIQRGLMIRHLVMPGNVGGTKNVMEWIGDNLPKDTYVNIMSQYQPDYKATDLPEISRGITREEYMLVIESAQQVGLVNLELQGMPY